jgi:DNA-binding NtrC family response regulator
MCLTEDDADLLKQYDWPGNVRELQNVIERAMIMARGTRLRLDLAMAHTTSESVPLDRPTEPPSESPAAKIVQHNELKRIERESILAALERAHHRISGAGGAAELLGINPSTLFSRIRSLGIIRRSQTESVRPRSADLDSTSRAEASV